MQIHHIFKSFSYLGFQEGCSSRHFSNILQHQICPISNTPYMDVRTWVYHVFSQTPRNQQLPNIISSLRTITMAMYCLNSFMFDICINNNWGNNITEEYWLQRRGQLFYFYIHLLWHRIFIQILSSQYHFYCIRVFLSL